MRRERMYPKTMREVSRMRETVSWLALVLCLASAGGPRSSWAVNAKAGTGGGAFLKVGAGSARAASLGRAYVAIADGTDAMIWNPAGIAASSQREFSFGMTDWVQGVAAHTVGYVHPFGRTVAGVSATYMSVGDFEVRDEQGLAMAGSHVSVRDAVVSASVAHSFLYEKLFLGLSVKSVMENNAGSKTNLVVEDLGAIVRPFSQVSLGVCIQNLSNDKKRVASTQRLGAAYRPSAFFNMTTELSKDSDNSSRVGAGAEFILPEDVLQVGSLAFRVGFYESDPQGENQGDAIVKGLGMQRTSGISFGVGIYSSEVTGYGLGLDYALVPVGALGVSHQVVFRTRF